jgi:TM2 domain-containing membrane protein YozV
MSEPIQKPVRSKVLAGLLAFYGGWFGAHWFYLGRPKPWLLGLLAIVLVTIASQADVWWDTPAIFLLFIPALVGFVEAIVLCLMSDERFDARYNPGYQREYPTGWGPVLVAASGLLLGTVLMLFGIAHVVLHIWTRLGWLDGLNF